MIPFYLYPPLHNSDSFLRQSFHLTKNFSATVLKFKFVLCDRLRASLVTWQVRLNFWWSVPFFIGHSSRWNCWYFSAASIYKSDSGATQSLHQPQLAIWRVMVNGVASKFFLPIISHSVLVNLFLVIYLLIVTLSWEVRFSLLFSS